MAGFACTRKGAGIATALLIAVLAALIQPASAEPVFPDGAQWGIEPPPGFTRSTGAVAFTHPSGAMIMIVSSAKPHDFSKLPAVGSVAGKAEKAIRIEAYEDATVGGVPARLMVASSVVDRSRILQLMPQGASAGIVLALVPASPSPPVDMAAVRAALLSARERRLDDRQQLDALPVKVGDIDGMRVAGTVANLGVILTDGPEPSTTSGPAQSFVMLLAVPLEGGSRLVPQRDRQVLIDRLYAANAGARNVSAYPRTVGGMDVLEATFENHRNQQIRQVVALARALGDSNLIVWLEAPVGQKPDVARLERIFTSVAPK